MTTTVATWGNSEAVRIPRQLLHLAGLHAGDRVDLRLNEKGLIEVIPEKRSHRRVVPAKGITYAALTKDFKGEAPSADAYWTAGLESVGAEREGWE